MLSIRYLLVVGAFAAAFATETVAHACSEAARPEAPPCTKLSVYAPGARFPLDLANAIRVSAWRVQDGAMSALDAGFPLSTPLQVFRETASGFEAAPFELEGGAGLVSNARTLRLLDPQPGRYQLAWDGDTCGTAKNFGGFTLTPRVPLPATLGTLAATPLAKRGRDFQEGVGGDCRPIVVHHDEAEVTLTLTPSADLLPWADAITYGLEVDGQIAVGFSKPDPIALAEGRLSIRVARICATDTPRYLDHPGIAEGRHVGKMIAKIEGLADLSSAEVPFEIRCDVELSSGGGDGVDPGGSSSDGGGCNASAGSPEAGTLLMAALAAAFVGRRRRAR